jgi:hypothetical protein
MDRTYLQLNFPNTVTVFLMVSAGYLMVALLVHALYAVSGRSMAGS